jgi:hypothetical protein
MLALFNLIKSLSKEEKRLYNIYGNPARYQNIYQAYQKALEFHKSLDTEIFQNYYSENSKAYYSMQKRELYEDILSVLLTRSNSQNPVYQFYNMISSMGILIERKLYQEAKECSKYFKLDFQLFPNSYKNLFNELIFTAFESMNTASYSEFVNFLKQSNQEWDFERVVLLKIKLLNLNLDGLDIEKIQTFADEIYQELKSKSVTQYPLKMASIHALKLKKDYLNAHKELIYVYESQFKDSLDKKQALDCLIELMSSCLKNGDFLNMNSILYKTRSKIHLIPEEYKSEFLLSYNEYSSLFHFYENDLPSALKEIQYVIEHSKDPIHIEKCICYKMAMLVAGDLQYQLTNELAEYSAKYPDILNNPYIIICDILASINNLVPKTELNEKIEKLESIGKKSNQKNIITVSKLLYNFIFKKKGTEEEVQIYPNDWEPILLVHLWIKAKIERVFYYNLVIDEWLKRRKVF